MVEKIVEINKKIKTCEVKFLISDKN
jgi:hypothetical protein